MKTFSCHCGAVRITLGKRPDYINACNCSICGKSGARWGYFHPSEVHITGATTAYHRSDKAEPGTNFHFCPVCGSTTHFSLTESAVAKYGNTLMGVNMWLADESELAGIELRFPDGRAWPGEGEFGYWREARIIGDAPAAR
ncbi:aldehyde-activating protein [Novosphingobium flavum]|uniref:Aldehyde-activating protein n=1 Tax=Novosphingobium flavum TaxID=1778672 RepID=A0A7X1FSC5_9SPHN|nr:aldehyde-activating protein [Novosphingobium flavum]MBC2665934.1 aldehyde-activating protein [Novosphingobium flavum]